MPRVRVQETDFDVGRELETLACGRKDIGAIASFVGLVRGENDGDAIAGMTLEHYPGMTEKALEGICDEAHARWRLLDMLVIHRVGRLAPDEAVAAVGQWQQEAEVAPDEVLIAAHGMKRLMDLYTRNPEELAKYPGLMALLQLRATALTRITDLVHKQAPRH